MTATTATSRPRFSLTRRAITIAVVATVAFLLPWFGGEGGIGVLSELWAFILAIGVSLALMSISLNILMGYAGQISLGHAGLVAAGAYTSGLLTDPATMNQPFFLGLLVAGLVGGAVAFLVGLPALRLKGLFLAITTVAFLLLMLRSVLLLPWLSSGNAGVELVRPYVGTFQLTANHHYLAILTVLLVLFWVLDENVVRTKLGRAFNGIREDELVAASYGVNVAHYKLLAFVISGALAGVAGAAFGHNAGFVNTQTFEFEFSLELVMFVVIGGLGSRMGVVIAGLLFGVFPEMFSQVFRNAGLGDWIPIVGAAVLIFTVVENPHGFAGAIREAREKKAIKAARERDDELDDEVPPLPEFPTPVELQGRAEQLAPGDPVLEVHDVTVRFGGLTAVDRAGLVVPKGAIVGLIGPNGAGKTTLFNAVSGFVKPETGSVRFLGEELSGLAPHDRAARGIGRTFQHHGLVASESVLENLLLAQHTLATYAIGGALVSTRRKARTEAALRKRALEVIEALGFEDYTDTPVKHLSGGQRRIVEMASTLVTAPELLMLDEPSAGMAPAAVENLADRLRELRDEHDRTMLLIEHHVPLVLDVCDLVYVLDHGVIIARGTPDEIMQHPEVLSAYLGEREADLVAEAATRSTGVREEVTA